MFDSVLVANRGEIACRILKTVQAMGYRGIAVYSEADANAPHVLMADLAVCIGGPEVSSSYLNTQAVLAAAAKTGAGAIHPGYGFLSENAGFARACAAAGLVFVGPTPEAIDAMGDKAASKKRMRAAGVPCVPGFDDDPADDVSLIAAGATVGFPLLVKASAGGGGRGMRRVDVAADLASAIRSARAEAQSAFGNGALILERLVEGARHVEVQVMADTHGTVVSLGERDCSVQRRHQKVIEEAPSPAVDAVLRARMSEAAVRAAEAVGYVGAGTVEFLLAPTGDFYFLEMNTRLQVEHPVTEAVTGLDLVELQLRVAAGEPLPSSARNVELRGHAIEARIYAEDPAAGYLPSTGRLVAWDPAREVRVDSAVGSTEVVSAYYDPMIAKVIAWGPDRATALRRLRRELQNTVTLGIATNRRFLARIIEEPDFAAGKVDTQYLSSHDLTAESEVTLESVACAAFVWLRSRVRPLRIGHPVDQPVPMRVGGVRQKVRLLPGGIAVGDQVFHVDVSGDALRRRATVNGVSQQLAVAWDGADLWVQVGQDELHVEPVRTEAHDDNDSAGGTVRAPMAGRVLGVRVEEGQSVQAGDVMIILEAMKIETSLRAAVDGVARSLRVSEGDVVKVGDALVTVEAT